MYKIIESPAPCQVRSVIHFLSARNLPATDIHRQICEVYGTTAMCEGKVRKWVRDFKAGSDNVHGDSCSGRPSVITDDMVALVEGKILENRRFTISTLSNDSPEVSRNKIRRGRTKARTTLLSQVIKDYDHDQFGLYFHGRKDRPLSMEDNSRKVIIEEHISLVKEPGSEYIGHVSKSDPPYWLSEQPASFCEESIQNLIVSPDANIKMPFEYAIRLIMTCVLTAAFCANDIRTGLESEEQLGVVSACVDG
ncbi:hypothetical protein AVEN_27235-1 [Araneus ventricosus]|uniref:Mos1 transposase HTH domain-containing protein n=1 Tax=Araneus ventricosus TaxID=182803 RepID=A0A4Y2CCS8_ARAVE|nr:hypothetical protein AVEN_27235-1 [Araneus ventricosus]